MSRWVNYRTASSLLEERFPFNTTSARARRFVIKKPGIGPITKACQLRLTGSIRRKAISLPLNPARPPGTSPPDMLIRHKIISGSVLLVIAVVAVTLHFVSWANTVRQELRKVATTTSALTNHGHDFQSRLDGLREIFVSANQGELSRADATTQSRDILNEMNRALSKWAMAVNFPTAPGNPAAASPPADIAAREREFVESLQLELPLLEAAVASALLKPNLAPLDVGAVNEKIHGLLNRSRIETSHQLSAIEAQLHRGGLEIWFSGALVCAIAVGFGLWSGRELVRPVQRLIEGTQRVGTGDFAPLTMDSRDEFGQLAEAVSHMAARLNETTVSKTSVDRILATMVNTLLIVDRDGRVTFANASARKLLGYADGEISGQKFASLLGPGEPMTTLTQRIRAEGAISEVEVTYLTRTGATVPMTFSGALQPEDGSLVCVAHDITGRKAAEQELDRVHRELQQASKQAGMAEVANGVLHNVGNVLNSLNVAATVVGDRVLNSSAGRLGEIVRLLREHESALPAFFATKQGLLVPGYLAKLHAQQEADRSEVTSEVARLRKSIEHIREIVCMQQNYARISGLTEPVALADIIDDAIQLNAGALLRHQVTLTREFYVKPTLTLDKHRLLQVLVNLIRNAKYACDDSGRPEKHVIVRTEQTGDRILIHVIDNGVGIPAENLKKIFQHGFTTRKDGHGFGLHSGAIAATDMKGTLHVQSAGPGYGAIFTIDLPAPAL